MEEKELKENFSTNFKKLRLSKKLTQSALAEKINYSDKAVSKWECKETLPDIETLSKVADFFSVTVNDLISSHISFKKKYDKKNIAITLLGFFLVWLATCVVYYFLNIFTNFNNFIVIIVSALPLSFVVLVVFSHLWFDKIFQFISLSGLIWSVAVFFYFLQQWNYWFIFVIAGFLQIMTIIWMWLKKIRGK